MVKQVNGHRFSKLVITSMSEITNSPNGTVIIKNGSLSYLDMDVQVITITFGSIIIDPSQRIAELISERKKNMFLTWNDHGRLLLINVKPDICLLLLKNE